MSPHKYSDEDAVILVEDHINLLKGSKTDPNPLPKGLIRANVRLRNKILAILPEYKQKVQVCKDKGKNLHRDGYELYLEHFADVIATSRIKVTDLNILGFRRTFGIGTATASIFYFLTLDNIKFKGFENFDADSVIVDDKWINLI